MYKHFSSRFFLNLIHQLSMILLIILIGNKLDSHSFGLVASGLIFFQISYSFTEWGFSLDSIQRINYKKQNINRLISDILLSKFIMFLISFSLLFLVYLTSIQFNLSFFLSLVALIFFASLNNLWYFQAINKTEVLILPTFLSRIISLIIVFIFLSSDSLEIVFLSQALAFAIPIIYGYDYIFSSLKFKFLLNLSSTYKVVLDSKYYFFSYLSQNYIHTLWGIPILLTLNPIFIGYYHICDQLIRAGNSINTLIPEVLISSIKNINDRNRVINSFILFLIPITIFLWLILPSLFDFIFNSKFNEAMPYIKISFLSIITITLVKLYGFPILGHIYSDNYIAKLIIKFGILNFVSVLFSIIFNFNNLLSICLIFLILNILFLFFILFKVFLKKIEI